MAGPAAALIPVTEAVEKASTALTADLVVFRAQVFRKVEYQVGEEKVEFLTPIDVEAHVNPISILGGAAAGLLGILAATIAWHGVSVPTVGGSITLFKGLKETTLGADLNRAYERFMIKRRIRASGGEVVDSRVGLTQAEKDAAILQNIGDAECLLLNREWQAALRDSRPDDAARFLQQAKEGRCPWAKSR